MIRPEPCDARATLYTTDLPNGYGFSTTIIVIPYFLERAQGHFALVKDTNRWLEFHRHRRESVERFVDRVATTLNDGWSCFETREKARRSEKRDNERGLPNTGTPKAHAAESLRSPDSDILAFIEKNQPCRCSVIRAGVTGLDLYATDRGLQRLRKLGFITYALGKWTVRTTAAPPGVNRRF